MELERVVNKCLEKNPDERYQTTADLIADLKHLQRMTSQSGRQTTEKTIKSAPKKKLWAVIAALLVIGIGLVLIFKPFSGKPESIRKSIAVLPFKNMSDSKEDEYFSDGLTEDIITQLSKISGIEKVIARTSTMQYKSSTKSVHDIGKELDVATILEGSVRRQGNQIRVVAQLIDVSTEGHVWADTYDKEMSQIFAIQSDVAQQIASVLKAKLLPSEKEIIDKRPTENLTAYDYYIKGREYYYLYRKNDNEAAVRLFKKAIGLDTNYALAYAGLADAYAQRRNLFRLSGEWIDSAIALSKIAIAKNGISAEAYTALGLSYEIKGFYQKALEANRKALEFNPNYAQALGNIGDELILTGNYVEGMTYRKKASSLNPTNAMYYSLLGRYCNWYTDDVHAEKYFKRALELQSDLPITYLRMCRWHIHQAQYQEASNDIEKKLFYDRDTTAYEQVAFEIALRVGDVARARYIAEKFAAIGNSEYIAYICWRNGKKQEAKRLFDSVVNRTRKEVEQGNEFNRNPYLISTLYAVQDKKGEALYWLRKAIDMGWREYRAALTEPYMVSLYSDEKFKQMIAEVKANVEEQKKRLEEIEKVEDK